MVVEFASGATGTVVSSTAIRPAFKHRIEARWVGNTNGTRTVALLQMFYTVV